jgi:hypothetical protein
LYWIGLNWEFREGWASCEWLSQVGKRYKRLRCVACLWRHAVGARPGGAANDDEWYWRAPRRFCSRGRVCPARGAPPALPNPRGSRRPHSSAIRFVSHRLVSRHACHCLLWPSKLSERLYLPYLSHVFSRGNKRDRLHRVLSLRWTRIVPRSSVLPVAWHARLRVGRTPRFIALTVNAGARGKNRWCTRTAT